MALMARPRRLLGVLILMMIAIPGLSMPFQRARIYSAAEYRKLAASSGWLQTRAWASWPKSVDRYLGDHFAFREALVKVGNRTFGRVTAPGAPPSVLDGGDDRLFLFEGLLASTGHEVDVEGAHDYASFACDLAGRLRAMRARLVVSIAPSPADIYPDDAPDLALPVYKPTNYDLIMAGLRGCGVSAVDLRPSLRAAKDLGQLYRRTDTHWTALGALIAYNRVVAAMGRPDFAIPPAGVRWTSATLLDGDLPRYAGRAPIPETVMSPDILQLPEIGPSNHALGISSQAGSALDQLQRVRTHGPNHWRLLHGSLLPTLLCPFRGPRGLDVSGGLPIRLEHRSLSQARLCATHAN